MRAALTDLSGFCGLWFFWVFFVFVFLRQGLTLKLLTDLELRDQLGSVSHMLGLKVCATPP